MEEEINTLRAQKAELVAERADLLLKVTELRRRVYEIQQIEKPALARAESATPAKFDFAAHDAAFVEWWSKEGSGFHPAAIEDREEFTRRIANLAWIISANAARKQEAAR